MANGFNIVFRNNHKDEVIAALTEAADRAMEIVGINVEKYAKALCPVGTPESTGKKGYRGGTLRNSITHEVETSGSKTTVAVGSNVEYAPYVELGTGPYFNAPPEWIEYTSIMGSGIGGGYVRPRPYLRPAIEDHINEYKDIIERELRS